MNDSNKALLNRFRSALAERTRAIVRVAEKAADPLQDDVRQELLGLLHTLKGEGRMLGLKQLASLCHALEEQLLSEDLDFAAFRAVVDGVSLAMAETTSDEESVELLRTVGEAMGLVSGEEAVPAPKTEDEVEEAKPAAFEATRWIQVDAAVVQKLGETLATLSVGFSEHAVGLSASTVSIRDAALRAEELGARLQDALTMALDLRLTSIESLLSSLGTHTRLMCQERGKPARVVVRAHGVRVERDVVEVLREPLLHLCTNAVVHGLEDPSERGDKSREGQIVLSARSSSSGVVISVADDGRGVDVPGDGVRAETGDVQVASADNFDLLFQPGFSTRKEADEVAGRGVGLDVVKRKIEAMGGGVEVESQKGKGTTFSLFVPALLTQQDVVAFEVGATLYGISAQDVMAIVEVEDAHATSIKFEGKVVPLRSLSSVMGVRPDQGEPHVLVLHLRGKLWALRVARLMGHFEVIRRPSSSALRERTGVGASAQLEDGRLLLILSSSFLEKGLLTERSETSPALLQPSKGSPKFSQRVLVADDSVVVRDLIAEILATSGYEVRTAENGLRALEEIAKFDPGVVITDVEMPEMDGFELLRTIRQTSATLPVILVTARSSVKDRQRASSLGASAYVAKGEFQRDSLVATVDRYYPKVT